MPNFPLEETDRKAGSGALAGEYVFGNTVPATTFREQSANAIWHGLRSLIKQMDNAGDLMDTNYAAALTGGFAKIPKALIRAGRRAGPNNFLDITSSTGIASPYSFDPPMDEHSFLVTGNNGDALVLSNDTKHSYRLIVLTNTSSVNSFYIMYGSGAILSAVLPPSSSICMFLAPGSPSAFWIPVGGDRSGSFDIELRSSVSGVLATGKCKWKIQSGFAHLTFYKPNNSYIYDNSGSPIASSHTFQITGASNTDFPTPVAQTSEGFGISFPMLAIRNNVSAVINAMIQSGGTKIDFFQSAILTDWTGVCRVPGFSISYPVLTWA